MSKKRFLSILAISLLLVSCNDENSGSNSLNPSISGSISSEISEKPSLPSISPSITVGDNVVDLTKAVELISNSESKDIESAKSSNTNIVVMGYDGGNRYNQTQNVQATTYQNNITIESGSIEQYFYSNPENVYKDTYDEVRLIEESNYIRTRVFRNGVFQNDSERVNLLTISVDPSTIEQAFEYYESEVSCGAGSTAFGQFYDAYAMGASFSFASRQLDEGLFIYFHAEYQTSEEQNQMIIFDFYYIFDNAVNGFLTSYSSTQAFYSLNTYLATEDKSQLVPTYFASTEIEVTSGQLAEFTGDFPVDIHASFVQEIRLTAPKTTLVVDEIIALKSEVLPATAINKELYFESSVPGIAKVDEDGRITAISKGECVITATNIDSGVSASISITVVDKPAGDSGDDSKKGDLKEALLKAETQLFGFEKGSYNYTTVPFNTTESDTGVCVFNSIALSQLSISDFAYDENLRKATYVAMDKEVLVNILPYEDNGVEQLSNRYSLNRFTVFRNVILSFEIYLSSSNTISYIIVNTRNDSGSIGDKTFANLTTDNIEDEIDFTVNQYGTLFTKFNSKGFAATTDEE